MSSINETQRKYLRKRLEEIKAEKTQEIRLTVVPPNLDIVDKDKKIEALLAKVGLTTRYPHYIQLPEEQEYTKQQEDCKAKAQEEIKRLTAVYNSVMDEIIMGSDSEQLKTAVDKLANFQIS